MSTAAKRPVPTTSNVEIGKTLEWTLNLPKQARQRLSAPSIQSVHAAYAPDGTAVRTGISQHGPTPVQWHKPCNLLAGRRCLSPLGGTDTTLSTGG